MPLIPLGNNQGLSSAGAGAGHLMTKGGHLVSRGGHLFSDGNFNTCCCAPTLCYQLRDCQGAVSGFTLPGSAGPFTRKTYFRDSATLLCYYVDPADPLVTCLTTLTQGSPPTDCTDPTCACNTCDCPYLGPVNPGDAEHDCTGRALGVPVPSAFRVSFSGVNLNSLSDCSCNGFDSFTFDGSLGTYTCAYDGNGWNYNVNSGSGITRHFWDMENGICTNEDFLLGSPSALNVRVLVVFGTPPVITVMASEFFCGQANYPCCTRPIVVSNQNTLGCPGLFCNGNFSSTPGVWGSGGIAVVTPCNF